jgi:glutamate 5-kinase
MPTQAALPAQVCRPEWANARRIVIKIGSALLADRETGALKGAWLASLMDDVAALTQQGKEVVLVSSGAIALGRHTLKLPKGALLLEQSPQHVGDPACSKGNSSRERERHCCHHRNSLWGQ